jgi:hypothetical protein
MIGRVCLRSPPKTTTFPPKGNLLFAEDNDNDNNHEVFCQEPRKLSYVSLKLRPILSGMLPKLIHITLFLALCCMLLSHLNFHMEF